MPTSASDYYSMEYKVGQDHGITDILTRLSVPKLPSEVPVLGETILVLDMLFSFPVTLKHTRYWTTKDLASSKNKNFASTRMAGY